MYAIQSYLLTKRNIFTALRSPCAALRRIIDFPMGDHRPPLLLFLDPWFVVRRIGFHVFHVFGVSGGSAEKWLRTTPHCTDGAGGTPAFLFFWPFGVPFFVLSKSLDRLLSERVSERSEKQLDVAAFSFSSKTVAVDIDKGGNLEVIFGVLGSTWPHFSTPKRSKMRSGCEPRKS